MHITVLSKENPDRWISIQKEPDPVSDNKANLVCFGHAGDVGTIEVTTGQEILLHYNTEDELETYIDTYVSESNYYKDEVENDGLKYIGLSGKYEYIPPEPEPEIE